MILEISHKLSISKSNILEAKCNVLLKVLSETNK